MRYLIFDIECCDGSHICEFGYCITDESFNIELQDNLVINPEHPIVLTGRKSKADITLFYSEEEYKRSPTFPHFYPIIKELLEAPDQIIGGFALSNDANFIKTACQNYNLPPINFSFVDAQCIFSESFGERKLTSLEDAGAKMGVQAPKHLHKSDEDAVFTLNLLKKMCEKTNMDLPELVASCPTCTGKSIDFKVGYDKSQRDIEVWVANAQKSPDNRIRKYKDVLFKKYILNSVKKRKNSDSKISGAKVCLDENYEKTHFREMLALVNIIAEKGGFYTQKVTDADFFVTYSAEDCGRAEHVRLANEHGKNIKIIAFENLLQMLGTAESALQNQPFPPLEDFTGFPSRQYTESDGGATIADLFKFKNSN